MHETVKPGDLYVYRVPFVDRTQAKPRPVLIVSTPNSKGDVQGIPGTTQIDNWTESHQIILKSEDLSEGALNDISVFPISKQMVLSPRFFAAKIGTVKQSVLEETLRSTTRFQGKQFQGAIRKPTAFIPGTTVIPAACKVLVAPGLNWLRQIILRGQDIHIRQANNTVPGIELQLPAQLHQLAGRVDRCIGHPFGKPQACAPNDHWNGPRACALSINQGAL